MSKKIIFLGLGNILLKDEGIGVHIIQELEKCSLPENCELIDGGTAGLDCLPPINEIEKLVIIDAIKGNKAPGTIYSLRPEHLIEDSSCEALSLHQVGIIELLSMAKKAGSLPGEVIIIGVEPKEIGWGLELTDCLKQKVPAILSHVIAKSEVAAKVHSRDSFRRDRGKLSP